MQLNSCPACDSRERRAIGRAGAAFATECGGRTFVQPEYHVCECQGCRLLYKSEVADADELDDYYRRVDFRKWEAAELFPNEQAVLDALANLPANSRVLDFGCSTGRLLSRLVGRHECLGFEINADAAGIAAGRGLTMVSAEELFGAPGMNLDALVLVDVFEHLTEPTDLLRKLVRQLRRGGRLVLCTGNADVPPCRKDPASFWYFRNVEHVCMLGRAHAEYLADALNAPLVGWRAVSHYRFGPREQVAQRLRDYTFDVLHLGRHRWLRPLLRRAPYFRKGVAWTERPYFNCTADHVVATFRKA